MITLVPVGAEDRELIEVARELFREYQRELGIDLCFQSFDEELASLPGKYARPAGLLLLAHDDGEPVACGAVRDLGEDVCEIKRIYVRPRARRRGLARTISEHLMDFGRTAGYRTVRLDTLRRLTGALALYHDLGFSETRPYNFNPEPDIVYMERPL